MRKILITMLVCVTMPVLCNAECPTWTLESTQGDRYSTRLARSNPWSGPWQLMPATSKHYGCDNPENPICATHAAAKYLRKLLNDFDGNERDAIIGYNMGGANYKRRKVATVQAEALADEVMCLFTHDPLNFMSY